MARASSRIRARCSSSEPRCDELDRDLAREALVDHAQDHAHPTHAQLAHHAVDAVDQRPGGGYLQGGALQ
jgi:hypothetical protein